MTKALIAKPVVKNQFWIVTDGNEKVGNVIAAGSGFDVKINGGITHFKNTSTITKQTHIEFERNVNTKSKQEIPFGEFPTPSKIFNSVLDIKRKLHLFTKTAKSKCYYAAGWYTMSQGGEPVVEFCPKYIFVQRYEYTGPFKTKEDAENTLNKQ
jgi:hypothetical protein